LSTAECAAEFATRHGLPENDPRVTVIGNRLSSVLDLRRANGLLARPQERLPL
jgi:hypothetical protein